MAVGAGGQRMQGAGLEALVDFEELPVSGFGDVLPKFFKLRKSYQVLLQALRQPQCLGLVAIDYPGFNMRLIQWAKRLRKPALYVAPPQVWAWKRRRAKILAENTFAKLAVFFDFEKQPFLAAGCPENRVVQMLHPFFEQINSEKASGSIPQPSKGSKPLLLLPGSRRSQGLRNLPFFLEAASKFPKVTLVAARQSLVPFFCQALKNHPEIQIVVAPSDAATRFRFYHGAQGALVAPGTSTLELALSGCPLVVGYQPDTITYFLAKRFLKNRLFALPNILVGREVFREFILPNFNETSIGQVTAALNAAVANPQNLQKELSEKLSAGVSASQLMSEFLAQIV